MSRASGLDDASLADSVLWTIFAAVFATTSASTWRVSLE